MEASSAKGEENEAREDDATATAEAASEEEPASESADTQADSEPDTEESSDEPQSADADEEPESSERDEAESSGKADGDDEPEEDKGGYLRLSRLQPTEFLGCAAAVVLALSLFLPWFATSSTNDESSIALANGEIARGGDTVSAWLAYPIMRWFVLAMAIAPFGLVWVVARGHKLDWRPGELTMVVGVAAFVLVFCNGILLGKPGDTVEISLQWGYPVALVAGIGIAYAGYRRQARSIKNRKPPGTI